MHLDEPAAVMVMKDMGMHLRLKALVLDLQCYEVQWVGDHGNWGQLADGLLAG